MSDLGVRAKFSTHLETVDLFLEILEKLADELANA